MQTQLQARFSQTSYLRNQQQMTRQTLADEATLTYGPALAKLKTEADKIRKWKTATQFELKRKESQLGEVRVHLETAQEEVTRVRVREETLKTQLLDQQSTHTELQHKVLVTRGLCSTLKEKVECAELSLNRSQTDQDSNRDIDNLRLEQYREFAGKFRELEMKQNRVQSSLEEALTNERENGCGLEFKLTNEIARSKELENEVEKLQNLLQTARTECEGVKVRAGEVQRGLEEVTREKERYESVCGELKEQLRLSREDCHSLHQTISLLREQVSSIESEKVAVETRLDGEKRDWEQKKRGMEMAVERQQEALVKMQSELEVSVRERENLEISLKAVREELCAMEYNRRDDVARLSNEMREKEKCHYQEIDSLASQLGTSQTTLSSTITQMRETESVLSEKEQELAGLNHSLSEKELVNAGLVVEIERVRVVEQEGQREREREMKDSQTTISSLKSQLEVLQTQLEETRQTDSERVEKLEKEKNEMGAELAGIREHLTEVQREGERAEREGGRAEREGEVIRRESEDKVRQFKEETERIRETQLMEKEGFDTQVTELCGMLEQYRNENQRIVEQKDLQIQSLQTSLTQSREHKEEVEEVVRGAQGELERLGEEVERVRGELREREEEVKDREGQVREKDEEMAELLKAVDTLRQKQQSLTKDIPQSTTHTPHHPPHTPTITPTAGFTTPLRPPVVKRLRHELDDDGVGVASRYDHAPTDHDEEILFRKPRPLGARPHSSIRPPRSSSGTPRSLEPPSCVGPPRSSGPPTPRSSGPSIPRTPRSAPRDDCVSSVDEVSSTDTAAAARSTSARRRQAPSRVQRGRREKVRGGRKPAAGTAWFDLDAVFGFGPED